MKNKISKKFLVTMLASCLVIPTITVSNVSAMKVSEMSGQLKGQMKVDFNNCYKELKEELEKEASRNGNVSDNELFVRLLAKIQSKVEVNRDALLHRLVVICRSKEERRSDLAFAMKQYPKLVAHINYDGSLCPSSLNSFSDSFSEDRKPSTSHKRDKGFQRKDKCNPHYME